MALTQEQQVIEAIARSSRVLVVCAKTWTVDALATALALAAWLRKKGKRADVAADGFAAPTSLAFLPGVGSVQPDLRRAQTFVVSLDLTRAGIDELSYDVSDKTLRISIVPKHGQFAPSDVRGERSAFAYDLVVLVGVRDLPSLGRLFDAFPDLFHRVPTINLDFHASNERHGNINAVDIAAASCAEVAHSLLRTSDARIDEDAATCLLAGIIAETKSFRSPNVSTRTLETAAELVAAGGKRELVVDGLYRTKSVPSIKLWGRALSRLKHDAAARLAWTVLTTQDFVQTGADAEHLSDVLEEIVGSVPGAEAAVVVFEGTGADAGPRALVHAPHADARRFPREFSPESRGNAVMLRTSSSTIIDAEKTLIAAVIAALAEKPAETRREQRVAPPPASLPGA